jgi:hypothetical protein
MPWKHNYLSRYSVAIILFTDTLITSSPTNLIKITSLICSLLLTCHCADLPCHDTMSLCRSPMPWHHVTVQISRAMTPCHCADLLCHDTMSLCRSPVPWHHVTVQISHAMTPCHCAALPCHDTMSAWEICTVTWCHGTGDLHSDMMSWHGRSAQWHGVMAWEICTVTWCHGTGDLHSDMSVKESK